MSGGDLFGSFSGEEYQSLLKYVLRKQIQMLIDQLYDETGDETLVLVADITNGTVVHLGTDLAKVYPEEVSSVTCNFLTFLDEKHMKNGPSVSERRKETSYETVCGSSKERASRGRKAKRKATVSPEAESSQKKCSKLSKGEATKLAPVVTETLEMDAFTEAEQDELLHKPETESCIISEPRSDAEKSVHLSAHNESVTLQYSLIQPQSVQSFHETSVAMTNIGNPEGSEFLTLQTSSDMQSAEKVDVKMEASLDIDCGGADKDFSDNTDTDITDILENSNIIQSSNNISYSSQGIGEPGVSDENVQARHCSEVTGKSDSQPGNADGRGSLTKKKRSQCIRRDDNMKAAVKAVRDGQMSIRGASRQFNIPDSTLRDRINGKTAEDPLHFGPKRMLSPEEEDEVVHYIFEKQIKGESVTSKDIAGEIKRMLDEARRTTLFKDNLPGARWMRKFKKRHPELVNKIRNKLTF